MERDMSAHKKITIKDLRKTWRKAQPLVMVTAYDFPTARLADQAGVDCILVGDSLGQVCLGYDQTTRVSMDDMLHHCRAVARAKPRAFTVADMPFGSYGVSRAATLKNALRLISQAGADAVKLEGSAFIDEIKAMGDMGIPVLGHLGFTPQSINRLGGFTVAGKTEAESEELLRAAQALQAAGAVMLVLECVPADVAASITAALHIPTIGIGAGAGTSGQVLVFHDVLGLSPDDFQPRFLKRFAQLGQDAACGLRQYADQVRRRRFPGPEHCYTRDQHNRGQELN